MTKKSSQFLAVFASEFVEIISDLSITTSINVSEEGHTQPVDVPLTVSGFVMDVDDVFVYLSTDGENVSQALPIDSIKHVAIVDVNKAIESIEDIDIPEDNGSYH